MRSVFCLTFASTVSPRLRFELFAIGFPTRSFDPQPPRLIELAMLRGEEVEQQPIVEPAVDVMALPLPADEAEAQPPHPPQRRVVFHRPRVDHVQSQLAERKTEKL